MESKISVIIPTYNRVYTLKRAIDSVLNQSYKNFELIIVDDGSNDETPNLIKSYTDKLLYIRVQHKGPAYARNIGIKISRYNYIAFLDSDDWWNKNKLLSQLDYMAKHPTYAISHTQEVWYKNGKILNQKKRHRKYGGYIFERCLPLCAVGISTVIIKREVFEDVGYFDESLPACEDYDFWLRTSLKYNFLFLDQPLTSKEGGRDDQLSYIYRIGIDRFRIKALLKLLKNTHSLKPHQIKAILLELERKCTIYGKGCLKHNKISEGNYYLSLPEKYKRKLLKN